MAKQTSSLAKIIPIRSAEMMASNNNVTQLERASKEIDQKQEERDNKQLKSQEKLTSNLDRLIIALQDNLGSKVSGNKAAELGKSAGMPDYKQGGTWDQRSVKDQFKDRLMGRAGADGKRDSLDPASLKYKFGTLKGFADTTNIVNPDSFFGNLLGRREDRMKRTDTLTKLNPQMKNLKQFGGDEDKVRAYYDKQYNEQYAPAQAKLQGEQYKLDSLMASGISESELERTIGGKKQIKSRDTAAADLLLKDKMKKGEVKELTQGTDLETSKTSGFAAAGIGASNVIPFPGSASASKETELENIRLMNNQNSVLQQIQENTASMPKLLEIFTAEAKREAEADKAQIEAAAQGGGGGGGSGLMDMVGKGTKGKVLGGLKAAGSVLGKGALAAGKVIGGALLSKPALIAGGVALAGYGLYKGYQALTKPSEKEQAEQSARGEEMINAKRAEKLSSTDEVKELKKLASTKKYTFKPEVTKVIVTNKETGEVSQIIQAPKQVEGKPGIYTGEDLLRSAGITPGGEPKKETNAKGEEVKPVAASPEDKAKSMAGAATTTTEKTPTGTKTTTTDQYTMIGGERVVPGQPLSDRQMAGITLGKMSGNSYSPEIEKQYNTQKAEREQKAKPQTAPPQAANRVADTSAENQAVKETPAQSNNVQTNVSQTNVQQRNTQAIKPPIRNQDSSYGRMVDKRYAY